jgi:hypothetical protein
VRRADRAKKYRQLFGDVPPLLPAAFRSGWSRQRGRAERSGANFQETPATCHAQRVSNCPS